MLLWINNSYSHRQHSSSNNKRSPGRMTTEWRPWKAARCKAARCKAYSMYVHVSFVMVRMPFTISAFIVFRIVHSNQHMWKEKNWQQLLVGKLSFLLNQLFKLLFEGESHNSHWKYFIKSRIVRTLDNKEDDYFLCIREKYNHTTEHRTLIMSFN